MMTYNQTPDDETIACALRQIIDGSLSGQDAHVVITSAFTPLVNWDPEALKVHLEQVYQLTPEEIEHLYERDYFPIEYVKEEPMPLVRAFPIFKRTNNLKPGDCAKKLWKARKLLSEAQKTIESIEISQEDFINEKHFYDACAERLRVQSDFIHLNYFVDAHLEHANKFIHKRQK
mgnify:CR=1 FL=1